MGYVIEFTPKRKRDAEKNFSDFITFCQKLKYFGDDLDWNSGFWDISKYVEGIAGRNSDIRLWWSNVDCKAATKPGKRVLMIQPFLNFARGYIIHEQGCNPSKGGYDFRLKALRVLERAMVELTGEADVVKLNSAIFNRALQLIEEKYAKIMHARSQFDLEAIAKFLNEKHLVSCRFSWKGWIKHSLDWSDDSEAEANRKKKLPSKEALYALGGIFYDSKMPADEVVSSIMAILIAAPDRISECFRLPVNCEDVGIEVSIHGTHEKSYGLRWWPSKGGKPLVKPVLPSWVEITKKAIKKLNKHGKEAREMAKWYEENPDQLYLPEDLAYLRGQPLSKEDLRKLLGLPPNAGVRGKGGSESLSYFIRKHNLTKIKVPGACSRKGAYFHFQFAEFEEVILSMLPKFFPFASNEQYGHVKCSESLMVVPKGLLNTKRTVGPYRCMFEVLSYNQIAGQLRHIFARNGKFGPD